MVTAEQMMPNPSAPMRIRSRMQLSTDDAARNVSGVFESPTLFIAWESRIAAMRYDSVGIRISVVTPDSLRFTEQVRLQDSAHGEGDFREWHTPYRSHARLKHIGEYVFSFVPSQATDGLRAIGMEITPTEHGKR